LYCLLLAGGAQELQKENLLLAIQKLLSFSNDNNERLRKVGPLL
jgi:hypothetical protein